MEARYSRPSELLYKSWDNTQVLSQFKGKLTKARNKPSRTVNLYRQVICSFWKETGIQEPDKWLEEVKAGKKDVEGEFIAYMEAQIAKPELGSATLNLKRSAILKFCKVMKLPIPDLPQIGNQDRRRNPVPFTNQDVRALLGVSKGPRDRALVILASTSGLRRCELSGLRVQDVELDRDTEPYRITVGSDVAKGARSYVSFTTQEGIEALRTYITKNNLQPGDLLFPQQSRIHFLFRRLVREANLPGERVFHSLRKFCKTALLSAGVPEWASDRIIGHKLGTIQQVYNTLPEDQLRQYYLQAISKGVLSFYGTPRIHLQPELVDEIVRVRVLQTLEALGIVTDPSQLPQGQLPDPRVSGIVLQGKLRELQTAELPPPPPP